MTITEAVQKKLSVAIEALELTLCGGGCASYDEYRHLCGQIQGLRTALMVQNDLLRIEEESDE